MKDIKTDLEIKLNAEQTQKLGQANSFLPPNAKGYTILENGNVAVESDLALTQQDIDTIKIAFQTFTPMKTDKEKAIDNLKNAADFTAFKAAYLAYEGIS